MALKTMMEMMEPLRIELGAEKISVDVNKHSLLITVVWPDDFGYQNTFTYEQLKQFNGDSLTLFMFAAQGARRAANEARQIDSHGSRESDEPAEKEKT
jgi:hypothetical protein